METPAAWVGAIAAIAAAAIVAWQSWETRRSAQASQAAARAAQEAVATANETLNLSREQAVTANESLKLSRQQAAEAIRARIDAAMPAITIHASPAPDWPPREPSVGGFGKSNELPYGDLSPVMHVPRDNQRQIAVRLKITISNDSDRTVEMTANGLLDGEDDTIPQPLRLASGAEVEGWFSVTRTLEEWVVILKEREAGDGAAGESVFNATYIDPADSGAIDSWSVIMGGTPIERVSELEGGLRIVQDPTNPWDMRSYASRMAAVVLPRDRRYYRSRIKNLSLHEEP
jgi:hypothetical protein